MTRQLPRQRQRHAHNAAFGRGVSYLPDLPLKGRHRGRSNDHAPSAILIGLVHGHGVCGAANHVKGADQVHLQHAREPLQVVDPAFADELFRYANACGSHGDMQPAVPLDRFLHRAPDLLLIRDICLHKRRNEMSDRGVAELRHARSHVRPGSSTIQQNVAEPIGATTGDP